MVSVCGENYSLTTHTLDLEAKGFCLSLPLPAFTSLSHCLFLSLFPSLNLTTLYVSSILRSSLRPSLVPLSSLSPPSLARFLAAPSSPFANLYPWRPSLFRSPSRRAPSLPAPLPVEVEPRAQVVQVRVVLLVGVLEEALVNKSPLLLLYRR